jgi:peroxiredoxin Q/BCP
MLKEGDKAPDFSLPDQSGNIVSLKDFAGKTVIVYFYPKDNTPGCTKEACSFRDEYTQYEEKGAVVLGISKDSQKSHTSFISKYDLPFSLLSDTEGEVIQAFGAWGEKSMYGKTYEGIIRSTFVIDGSGTIKKVFDKVKTASHGVDVLEVI